MNISKRISMLPPYLFDEIDRLKAETEQQGKEVIDFGVGDPDLRTPEIIVDELVAQAGRQENHQYPGYKGLVEFRQIIANYYEKRGVSGLDIENEILCLIGSKEGIAHLPLALVDPGDVVLIPDPGYPVYLSSTLFAGGIPYTMPLLEENRFLPDLESVPSDIAEKAKLMFINYPNNPTSGIATKEFFTNLAYFSKKHDICVCHDASYLDITFDGYRAPSYLESPISKENGIEMISFSKTFNMTGWRLAAAVGNKSIISALLKIKMNIDSGVFNPIQYAGITALEHFHGTPPETLEIYAHRKKMLCQCFDKLGWTYVSPKATFYLWVKIPDGTSSMDFTKKLLVHTGCLVTPGTGFGKYGEGYIRFSLTLPSEDVALAVKRLSKFQF